MTHLYIVHASRLLCYRDQLATETENIYVHSRRLGRKFCPATNTAVSQLRASMTTGLLLLAVVRTSNSNQLVSRSAMAAGQLITHRACMRAPVSPDTRQATDVLGRRARSGRRSRGPRAGEHTSIGTPVLPSADPIIRSIQPAPRRAGRQRRRQANRYRRTELTALQQ